MQSLEPADIHRLNAALGWLELNSPAESRTELEQINAASQRHPAVLEIRWAVCAHEHDWNAALPIARDLLAVAPESVTAWLHHAYALRRADGGGLSAAHDALSPASSKFPDEPTVFYNMACYACQLGQWEKQVMGWLRQALMKGKRGELLEMALKDPDLEPMRSQIEALRREK